ncbi:hypothetical protein Tco_0376982, partial [Tanacetum coccineum]
SEMVKDSGKEDGDSQKQAESSKKRLRAEHDEESVKKQKLEDEAEREKLRACLDIVPGDDIAMDFESLAIKYVKPKNLNKCKITKIPLMKKIS